MCVFKPTFNGGPLTNSLFIQPGPVQYHSSIFILWHIIIPVDLDHHIDRFIWHPRHVCCRHQALTLGAQCSNNVTMGFIVPHHMRIKKLQNIIWHYVCVCIDVFNQFGCCNKQNVLVEPATSGSKHV